MGKFFITTAIHYVNGPPHIGHVYETVGADVLARYRRMRGDDVFFLTGTDEHGMKIARTAAAQDTEPRLLADKNSLAFQRVFDRLLISNDDFIRTTDRRHHRAVQAFWEAVEKHGDIYTDKYEGWYCIQDENFVTEKEAEEIKANPDLGKTVEWQEEEAMFFRLSAFQEWAEKMVEENPDFIQPTTRLNEMKNTYIKEGLRDVCISRSSIDWGIPVPGHDSHVIYVWFDALLNYISAIGYGADRELFEKWWPCDVHVIGKDITKFHTILWPAMLSAAGVEPPKRVFSHGFLTMGGRKMGKSLGNVIDPMVLVDTYGPEALRYALLRENDFGGDGNYDPEAIHSRYNSDLANALGNLVNRSLTMLEKFLHCGHYQVDELPEMEREILANFEAQFPRMDDLMNNFKYNTALAEIWERVADLNRYVNESKPWEVAKKLSPDPKPRLKEIFYTLDEGIRWLAVLINPFLPETADKIWKIFHPDRPLKHWSWARATSRGQIKDDSSLLKPPVLFPKVDKPEG